MPPVSNPPGTEPGHPAVPILFNYAQAARMLGRSETWLQRQVRYGTVPYRRLGRSVGFTRDDINAIVEGSYRAPGSAS